MSTFCKINKFRKIIEFNFFLLLVITTFSCIGLWGLGCEYILYDKDSFFSHKPHYAIMKGILGFLLHEILIGLIIICAGLPVISNETNKKYCTYCNVILYTLSILFFSINYITIFFTEIYIMHIKDYPVIFSSDSLKYVACGFLRIFPIIILLGYIKYHEMLPRKNAKIANVETKDNYSEV
ncbi:hypothetical protein CPAV1605_424 [seawater metagenome]|uniref:Uncharacterized protein n=1 Tax=seawater metagenome TaxID=1561972 RepID=A0A5E8CJA3_9ZZZZ